MKRLAGTPTRNRLHDSAHERLQASAQAIDAKAVAWRHDFHRNPELSNHEERTAGIVAAHLRSLGLVVRTGVGGHGVYGLLRGSGPGATVALRADMDALPLTERADVPFRSAVRATHEGRDVGVMHACGHDLHTAALMGAAEVLAGMRDSLRGNVVFIFQPAEEAPPRGGASAMIEQGVLDDPRVDAIFGLHTGGTPAGTLRYVAGPGNAATDTFRIVVEGKPVGGASPWDGVDPLVVGAQILLGLQTIVSRQMDLTSGPAVISVGKFEGGERDNLIPASAEMIGTIRTYDERSRLRIHDHLHRTVEHIAAASGATAKVTIDVGYPVAINDPALVQMMLPSLEAIVGKENVARRNPSTGGEDFARFGQKVPAMYVWFGYVSEGVDPASASPQHSDTFKADDAAVGIAMRTYAKLAHDYLHLVATR